MERRSLRGGRAWRGGKVAAGIALGIVLVVYSTELHVPIPRWTHTNEEEWRKHYFHRLQQDNVIPVVAILTLFR